MLSTAMPVTAQSVTAESVTAESTAEPAAVPSAADSRHRPRRAVPWRDARGRFSALKLGVLVALCLPGAVIGVELAGGMLGARPLETALHDIGDWTLRLLAVTLAVTPASRLLGLSRLVQLRRMIGVATFAYAIVHLALYAADQSFDLAHVASEIAVRYYLTIGFAALLILAALAATSTDGAARRLGGRRWRRLHRLVYVVAALAVVHFFLQTKAGADEPWVMAGLFAWLLAWRAAGGRPGRPRRWPAVWPPALAVAAALLTAGAEAVYYWIGLGAPPMAVLAANLMPELFPRPAVVVAAICLPVALAPLARRLARYLLRQPAGGAPAA